MSITVRLWSDQELKAIENRTADKNLITVFMNASTFSAEEIGVYPYEMRRVYKVEFKGRNSIPVELYATDDEAALWFIAQEYRTEAVKSVSRIMFDENGRKSSRHVKANWNQS